MQSKGFLSCFVAALLLLSMVQAYAWTTYPNWVSEQDRFTMSVALGDIDNDGYQDLLTGNYKYPYQWTNSPNEMNPSEFGDEVIGYQRTSAGFNPYATFTGVTPGCIDCIALGEATPDQYLDLAVGMVVGKGKDGGIYAYKHQGPVVFNNSYLMVGGPWHPDESYDCHCVRWVDYNLDGVLDLVTLEPGGMMRVYINLIEQNQDIIDALGSGAPHSGPNWFQLPPIYIDFGPLIDSLRNAVPQEVENPLDTEWDHAEVNYDNIGGTTMEFGDMDMDGDPDLYLNTPAVVIVFKHLYPILIGDPPAYYNPSNPGDRWMISSWPGYTDGKEQAFCGSFGFYKGQTLALAVGSYDFIPDNHPSTFDGYRNDIYTLNLGSQRLEFAWESEEYIDRQNYSQLVTDIQWAQVDNDAANYMDLVTCSYPTCTDINGETPVWDDNRGKEAVYLNPTNTGSTPYTQPWYWSNGTHDLSTSLALGDLDYGQSPDIIEGLLGTPGYVSPAKKWFYISKFPFARLKEVNYCDINNQVLETWRNDPLPLVRDFKLTYDVTNGWISIDRTHPVPAGAMYIKVRYGYGTDLDLAVGNDGRCAVYYHTGGATQATGIPTHLVPTLSTNHTYNQNHYLDPQAATVDLMAPDAIGANFGSFGIVPDLTKLSTFMGDYPSMTRIDIGTGVSVDVFQGHFLWGYLDKCVNEVFTHGGPTHNDKVTFFTAYGPGWSIGQYDPHAGSPLYDYHSRPTDERLDAMYVRALINRYRPNGVLATLGGYDWGNWGVCMFQQNNEPNAPYTGYAVGTNAEPRLPSSSDAPVQAMAEKLFYSYQMIKEISTQAYGSQYRDNLEVISPNFGTPNPSFYDPQGYNGFTGPDLPYLNALDGVNITVPGGTIQHALQNYADYMGQQMYCNSHDQYGLDMYKIDPFNPNYANNNPYLRLGLEQIFWGWYTPGLWEFYGYPEGNWNPVFFDAPEHPFFVYEWCTWWTSNPHPETFKSWTAAELGELFSVDVFPLPSQGKDHRLLRYNVSLGVESYDSTMTPVHNTCAQMLNDPTPDQQGNSHMKLESYTTNTPTNQPTIYNYTYRYGNTSHRVHFLKTQWDLYEDPLALYVTTQGGWNLPLDNTQNQYNYNPDDGYVVECYNPDGDMFMKPISWAPGNPPVPQVHFNQGEMGPEMLIMKEWQDVPSTNNQGVQLHPGWNLVSWNLNLGNGNPGTIFDVTSDISSYFGTTHPENKIYWYSQPSNFFYPISNPLWALDQAYYFNFDSSVPWIKTGAQIAQHTITVTPSQAWTHSQVGDDAVRWYFMPYTTNGYQKLASIPNNPGQGTAIGDPGLYTYEGPFHSLIWNYWNGTHWTLGAHNLRIVKDDQGHAYIPDPDPNHVHQAVDHIGMLEPGKGYFLGFYCGELAPFNFSPGWPLTSEWHNASSLEPGNPALHFQFKEYTHWSYPIVIDTVDLAQTPLETGDEIAVFDGDMCVGSAGYYGSFPIVLTAWEDDIATPEIVDGYTYGHEMTFKWYDASNNTEAEFIVPPGIYELDDPIAPTHSGFGVGAYGNRNFSNGVQGMQQLPKEFNLGQNFPNPFNSTTVIPFELPQRSKVKVELFNVRGQNLGVVYDGIQNAGWPKISYNASALSSGIYFYRITAEGLERSGRFQKTSKMLLLK